jgi:DNA-binding CsgD family transcriptional regulator
MLGSWRTGCGGSPKGPLRNSAGPTAGTTFVTRRCPQFRPDPQYNRPMLAQEKLLGLVGRIYDAAADPLQWTVFLEELAGALNGTSTAIMYHDLTSMRANLGVFVRSEPDIEQLYLQHYSRFDPYRAAWFSRFDRVGPDAISTGEDLVAPGKIEKTEYHNDFAVAQDVVHHMPAPLVIERGWAANLGCNRPASKGPFGPDEVTLLRTLFPHLQRAMQFHRKFVELEGQHRTSLDALDRLPMGVVLLEGPEKIIVINREAHRILSQNDGLTAGKTGLSAALPAVNQELRRLLNPAAASSQSGGYAGGSIVIPRPSGKRSFLLLVSPVARHLFPSEIGNARVIVFVTDPEKKPRLVAGALAEIYQLTPAESRLAHILVQGNSLVRAARRLGVSHNTARTHLQRIFQKTNTGHQAELVQVLLSGPFRT